MSDVYLRVWDNTGDMIAVDAAEEPRLDAAVSTFIDSGGTRDALVELGLIEGGTVKIRASVVHSWMLSTPESRFRLMEINKSEAEEREEFRNKLGIWSDE